MSDAIEQAAAPTELATARETLTAFVAASLETDYTVDADYAVYADDLAEQEAALANIAEMHRLLGVRQERLLAAHDEVDKLRKALGSAVKYHNVTLEAAAAQSGTVTAAVVEELGRQADVLIGAADRVGHGPGSPKNGLHAAAATLQERIDALSPLSPPSGDDSTADETPWKPSPGDTVLYTGEEDTYPATVLRLGRPDHHEALIRDDETGTTRWESFEDLTRPASSVQDTPDGAR